MLGDRERRAGLIGGGALILFGAWMLADNLGAGVLPFWSLWPLVLVALGAFSGLEFWRSGATAARQAQHALFLVLLGTFLLGFSVGAIPWRAMAVWWPVFLVIGGCARLAAWIAGGFRQDAKLLTGVLEATAGGVALLFTTGLAGDLELGRWLVEGWPLALIVIGAYLIASALLRSPRAAPQATAAGGSLAKRPVGDDQPSL